MGTTPIELPEWECRALLRGGSVGRVCVVDHDVPLALPVNYRMVEGDHGVRIVVRTSPTSLIGRSRGPASFEVDHVDLAARSAWSVIARGTLVAAAGDHRLPDPAPIADGERPTWMVLEVGAFSGRRFAARGGGDGYSVEWVMSGA